MTTRKPVTGRFLDDTPLVCFRVIGIERFQRGHWWCFDCRCWVKIETNDVADWTREARLTVEHEVRCRCDLRTGKSWFVELMV